MQRPRLSHAAHDSRAKAQVRVSPRALSEGLYSRLFETCDLYPIQVPDPAHVDFVPMTYESYHRSTFLDRRIRPAKPLVLRADIERLEATRPAEPPARICFIFHNAYCRSTLLANALAQRPHSLVLREPVSLLQVAQGSVPETRLPLLLSLLGRRNQADDTVFVKASSACNVIAPAMLAVASSARALFVYSGLRPFILAVLRDPTRAQTMRNTMASGSHGPADAAKLGAWWPEHDQINPTLMQDDAQLAAWVWIGRLRALGRLDQCVGPNRIAAIDGNSIAEAPLDALRFVSDTLGAPIEPSVIAEIANSSVWQQDAKAPSQSYDPSVRATELNALACRHETSLNHALDWARSVMNAVPDETMATPRRYCGLPN